MIHKTAKRQLHLLCNDILFFLFDFGSHSIALTRKMEGARAAAKGKKRKRPLRAEMNLIPADPSWTVVEEPEQKVVPIEELFPGATVVTADTPTQEALRNSSASLSFPKDIPPVDKSALKGARIVFVHGATASGKTRYALPAIYSAVTGKELPKDSPPAWDPQRAVVSQFGDPDDAKEWLGRVGLNTVPSWCKPYHILSTGERFRANLARRLRRAVENQTWLVLDNFGSALDAETAACCTSNLAKQLRRLDFPGAIIASSLARLCPWLQPDVACRVHAGTPTPRLEFVPRPSAKDKKPTVRMRIDLAACAESSATAAPGDTNFQFKVDGQAASTGGTVLLTTTLKDECTEMCDALFDAAFDGRCAARIPDFPNIDASYSFGFVTGPSGSLKSVLVRHYFGECAATAASKLWKNGVDVGCQLKEAGMEDVDARLRAVCLSPSVLTRPYEALSSGEQHQLDLLFVIGRSSITIDEFTSALDRSLARRVAMGIAAYNRSHGATHVVLAGCHADFLADVGFEWVYDTMQASMRPPHAHHANCAAVDYTSDAANVTIQLALKASHPSAWARFRAHHYKTANLSKLARCFVVVVESICVSGVDAMPACSGKEVAFSATIRHNGKKNAAGQTPKRAHRTVVLPQWQGLGIGTRLTDAVGEVHRNEGADFFGQTVHPAFGAHRDRSPLWEAGDFNHQWRQFSIENWRQRKKNIRIRLRVPRFIYQHKYVGAISEEAQAHLASRFSIS